jgi:hypothetical protein
MAEAPTRGRRDVPPKVTWDDRVEHLYESWLRRVAAAESGHRRMSGQMWRRYLALGLPVVVLTTIVGTSVFASLAADENGNSAASPRVRVLVGTVSLLAAVLSSLQTFLRYGVRSEGHRIAAMRYEALRRDMTKTLAMPPEARGDPVREVDSVRQRLDRYAKESPTIGEHQWKQLEREFHLSRVPPDPRWIPDTITIPEPETPDPVTDDPTGGQDGR